MKQPKFDIDYKGLESYLRSLKLEDIERTWHKPQSPKLVEAVAMDDIEWFKKDISKIDPEKIINYGAPFLVDALSNDLSICFLSRRKYKLPDGRVIRSKFNTTIIEDCRELWGTPLNGYWVIPKQFLTITK